MSLLKVPPCIPSHCYIFYARARSKSSFLQMQGITSKASEKRVADVGRRVTAYDEIIFSSPLLGLHYLSEMSEGMKAPQVMLQFFCVSWK